MQSPNALLRAKLSAFVCPHNTPPTALRRSSAPNRWTDVMLVRLARSGDNAALRELNLQFNGTEGSFRGDGPGSEIVLVAERESALTAHDDLYEKRTGTVAVRIQEGRIRIGSIQTPGFGYASEIDFGARMTAEQWRRTRG